MCHWEIRKAKKQIFDEFENFKFFCLAIENDIDSMEDFSYSIFKELQNSIDRNDHDKCDEIRNEAEAELEFMDQKNQKKVSKVKEKIEMEKKLMEMISKFNDCVEGVDQEIEKTEYESLDFLEFDYFFQIDAIKRHFEEITFTF